LTTGGLYTLLSYHKSREDIRRLISLFHGKKISCSGKTFAIGYSGDINLLKAHKYYFFLYTQHMPNNVFMM